MKKVSMITNDVVNENIGQTGFSFFKGGAFFGSSQSYIFNLFKGIKEKLVIQVLEILAVIFLAWNLSGLVWSFYPSKPITLQNLDVNSQISLNQQQSVDLSILERFDAFYVDNSPLQSTTTNYSIAPETTLDLKLKGVRFSGDEREGSAIISFGDNSEQLFRIGDEILNSVFLQNIYRDRVALLRSGTVETLYLNPEKTALLSVTQIENENTQSYGIALSEVWSSLQFQPRKVGQYIDGFVLGYSEGQENISQIGLWPGDILISVNGINMVSFERLEEVRSELRQAKSLSLELERDGQKEILELRIVGGEIYAK